jgi:hypothetical protein
MIVTDERSANQSLRQAIARSGGTVVEQEHAHVERLIALLIPASRLSDLIDRLGQFGKVVERPTAPDSTGTVKVVITW